MNAKINGRGDNRKYKILIYINISILFTKIPGFFSFSQSILEMVQNFNEQKNKENNNVDENKTTKLNLVRLETNNSPLDENLREEPMEISNSIIEPE